VPIFIPDAVVTGALVNAIAVAGRWISKAVPGLRKSDDVATPRWFETFRLAGTLPDQSERSPHICALTSPRSSRPFTFR
jgi:hypothetical protein